MELHEFHVLQRHAGAQRHRVAVAGAGVRRGRGEIGAAVAARRQNRHLRSETMDRAIVHLEADDAADAAVGIADQVEREIFDEELALGPQPLAIERVQDRMAGAVGGGAGALGDALAVVGRHAAERALIDLALFGARERHPPMIEFIDRRRRVAAEIFDRVLIAEPVRALDGVVHVPAPVVDAHVAERGGNAALRGDGMRARRKHLRDAGGLQTRVRAADAGAKPRAAGADDDHVERVVGDRIGLLSDRGSARSGAVRRHAQPFKRSRCAAPRKRKSCPARRRKTRWRSAPIPATAHAGNRGSPTSCRSAYGRRPPE